MTPSELKSHQYVALCLCTWPPTRVSYSKSTAFFHLNANKTPQLAIQLSAACNVFVAFQGVCSKFPAAKSRIRKPENNPSFFFITAD
mmetsp:Transcript_36543/g.109839  ORF Transcript_36543/g.109839 Transcript_36543/m.109839 type:complete len:87 (+) Transcript_36543:115-375(+)